jgi:hypothetical protein
MGCRRTGQIPSVQAIARPELYIIRHWRTDKPGVTWPTILSHIHIGSNYFARRIHIITVDPRAVVFILLNDVEAPNRRSIAFPPLEMREVAT